MIKALRWDRGQFAITVGKGDQVARQTVYGWVDQAKLWGIHRMADFYIITHLPSGRAVTRFGGAAGKRATARAFCAAITPLCDWRDLDPEKIGADAALAERLHRIALTLTGATTGSRFH